MPAPTDPAAVPVSTPAATAPGHRRAGWWSPVAVFVAAALAQVLVRWARACRDGQAFDWAAALVNELSSAAVMVLMLPLPLPLLLAAVRRWPLHLDTWKRHWPGYLAGALGWWLLHVTGMVVLRRLAHAALGGSYDFGPWPWQWFYELFKDVQVYALLVWVIHGHDWLVRRRCGEAALLAAPDAGPAVEPVERPQHFLVRKLGKEFLVATDDIDYAQAAGNYVNLRVRGADYPLRIMMAALEQRLDPARFVRSHRCWLVNRERLRAIEPLDGGEALLLMADGGQVPCSRRQLPLLRRQLEGRAG